MSDTYTTGLRLQQPVVGGDAGTWGTTLNTDLSLIDNAISGTTVFTINDPASTITLTANNGAVDQARQPNHLWNGTMNADVSVVIPAVPRVYFVQNNTAGATATTNYNLKYTTGSGNVAKIPNTGAMMFVFCDGTNCAVVSLGNPILTTGGIVSENATAQIGIFRTSVATGATITVAAGVPTLIVDSTGTLSTLTIVMPTGLISSFVLSIVFNVAVTTLTMSQTDGSTLHNAPTSAAIGKQVTATYNIANTSWYFGI